MAVTVEHITFDADDAAPARPVLGGRAGARGRPGRQPRVRHHRARRAGGRGAGALQPVWMFIRVPEPRVGKNRIHVDLASPDRRADVQRALAAGATHVADFAEYGTAWTTLRDIEGNVFDIGDGPAGA